MAEITDRESFESWLEDKPKEWVQVLAMRSALRVLPLVEKVFVAEPIKPEIQQNFIFSTVRASAISWVGRKYSTHDFTVAAYAANASATAKATDNSAYNAAVDAASAAIRAANAVALVRHVKITAARVESISVKTAVRSVAYAANAATNAMAYAPAAATDAAHMAATRAAEIWDALNRDVAVLGNYKGEPAVSANALAEQALWLNEEGENAVPEWALAEFTNLNLNLSKLNDNWHVWTEWYRSRLDGRESWGLNADNAENLMLRIAKQENDWWEQGPSIVNAEIAGLLAELREEEANNGIPAEPAQGPGLKYGLPKGKLSASGSHPLANEAEDQVSLHNRVKAKTEKLNDLMLTTANQYPELAEAVKEYLELINLSIDQIDVDGLWSVGGALFELKEAYAKQNHPKTMSAALEPPETAALSGLCRDHGALILGFERGVELVERADRFARNAQLVLEITEPSKPVLEQLTNDRDLVEDETRRLHQPILDALNETDWAVSRTSYSGYLAIRNSTLAIAKFLFGSKDQGLIRIVLSLAGAVTLAGYPVDQVALNNAIKFLSAHGSQLLVIFKHSPEMHAYVQGAINLIRHEKLLFENSNSDANDDESDDSESE